eukprot:3556874-Amphidinium_carterae.1
MRLSLHRGLKSIGRFLLFLNPHEGLAWDDRVMQMTHYWDCNGQVLLVCVPCIQKPHLNMECTVVAMGLSSLERLRCPRNHALNSREP